MHTRLPGPNRVARHPALPRYGVALLASLAALVLTWLLLPIVEHSRFIFFFAAIVVSAWYGGIGPALLATLFAAPTAGYFFIPPAFSLKIGLEGFLQLSVFTLVAILTGSLTEARRRAEQRARTEGERFRVTLASIGDAVIVTDTECRVTFMNGVAAQLTGWQQAQAEGHDIAEVFRIVNADTRQPVESPVVRVLREGTVIGLANHTLLIDRDGVERPIADSGAPIRDARGQVIGVVMVFRDVSELAQVEQERTELLSREQAARVEAEQAAERTARLQAVTAALSSALTESEVADIIVQQAVAALGADAAIVAVLTEDQSELEMLRVVGYPAEMVREHQRQAVTAPLPLSDAVRANEMIAVESRAAAATRYPQLNGAQQKLALQSWVNIPLALDGRVLGAMDLSFTRVRTFDGEDRSFLRTLAQQCAQALDRARLYEAERQARTSAEAALRLRDQFLSIAAHELKTPLTAILGNTQLFQRRVNREGSLTERDRQTLRVMVEQAERLNRLVLSLLDISRIESGQLTIERAQVDVCRLVRRVVDEVRPAAGKRDLQVQCETESLVIQGDELRLEQVFQNLIQNAIKYSPESAPVRVEVAQRDGQACVDVRDAGMGIAPAALPHLFERFYRAANAEQQHITGIGIGLYVVREIVELHGGQVSVESTEGQGSIFTVRLPIDAS